MMHERYKKWLFQNKISSIQSFVGKLSTIEKYEGNIDEHYKTDKCVKLLYRLTYSKEDQNAKRKPIHKIPIIPDRRGVYESYYNGTRDYKSRLNKYIEFLNQQNNHDLPLYPDESLLQKKIKYIEGAKKEITVNTYERNSSVRNVCIKEHGHRCIICGFDFGEMYGEEFSGKIHVHHINPLHLIDEEYELSPLEDLAPVCPNCHMVLHAKADGVYTIEEVKKFIILNGKCRME